MTFDFFSASGSREVNEDCLGAFSDGNRTVFIAADGLGGHGKGDVASRLAAQAFAEALSDTSAPLPDLLSRAFLRAHDAILAEQRRTGSFFQMKTTACALAIDGGQLMWGHIGDTRLYAFSHNRVKTRTLDHSVPQMLVLAREIKEREIRSHPDRNKLLRVLGVSGNTPRFELSEPRSLRGLQAFLLCTDGFWELILEKEMCALLRKSQSVKEWLQAMRETVEQRGAGRDMDNYSAIAVWV